MDGPRFDTLTRSLIVAAPRRTILAGLATALGGMALPQMEHAIAKKNKRKKKLTFNTFGCVDAGGKCRGNSDNCCSGICDGRKPKKGKKDKSRCVAHGQATCVAGQHEPLCEGTNIISCLTSQQVEGRCNTTTGNAGFCTVSILCFPCKKDKDCEAAKFGLGSACLACAACANTGGTACGAAIEL
jgi:hypothetical protein